MPTATAAFRPSTPSRPCAPGQETFDIEAAALQGTGRRRRLRAGRAARAGHPGRVIVMGMGKQRPRARSPPRWPPPARAVLLVHPAEASHGDLGMVAGGDLVLAIPTAARAARSPCCCPCSSAGRAAIAGATGGLQSTLARHADLVLDCSVEREACPLQPSPPPAPPCSWPAGDASGRGPKAGCAAAPRIPARRTLAAPWGRRLPDPRARRHAHGRAGGKSSCQRSRLQRH